MIILIAAITTTLAILIVKIEKDNKEKTKISLLEALELKDFWASEVVYVNKFLSIATNKNNTKLAIVKNFNPNNPTSFEYFEIATAFIEKLEKNVGIKISYRKKGEIENFNIYPVNNEVKNFIHKVFLNASLKKIETKYPQNKFFIVSTSDWECSYVWAYSPNNGDFAYFKTGEKSTIMKINLKKEHFTIDTKFKYFEAPIFGIQQQLMTYQKDFMPTLFDYVLDDIKTRFNKISDNAIYFDSFNNIIYLTNGTNSLQSVILNKIDEIYYQDNKISFSLANEDKTINYIANSQFILKFQDFMTNYNLKKIAQNFDHKSDKLINATPFTKFIIDFSRDRIIYCANLHKLNNFSFMTISFADIFNIRAEKSGQKNFVRLTTRNKEIIDVTCEKREVAQYIEAQIVKILG